jgi:hypothetical protein
MNKNLLPIGSVVLLNDSNKRVMIVGRAQKNAKTGKLWDYSACYYPEGILDPDALFLFNHDQIMAIFSLGFQDLEEFKYQKILNEKIDELNKQ